MSALKTLCSSIFPVRAAAISIDPVKPVKGAGPAILRFYESSLIKLVIKGSLEPLLASLEIVPLFLPRV